MQRPGRLPAQLSAAGGSTIREIAISRDAGVQVNWNAWFGTAFCEKDGRMALILQAQSRA